MFKLSVTLDRLQVLRYALKCSVAKQTDFPAWDKVCVTSNSDRSMESAIYLNMSLGILECRKYLQTE